MPELSDDGWQRISSARFAKDRQHAIVRVGAGRQYLLRLPHMETSEKMRTVPLEVSVSTDSGRLWQPVPLRLDFRSYLRYAGPFHRQRWPPENLRTCGVHNGHLALTFQDVGAMFDLPYEPTDPDRDTDWLATYDPERRHWTLQALDTWYKR